MTVKRNSLTIAQSPVGLPRVRAKGPGNVVGGKQRSSGLVLKPNPGQPKEALSLLSIDFKDVLVKDARNGLTGCIEDVIDGSIVRIVNGKRPSKQSVLLVSESVLMQLTTPPVAPPRMLGDVLRSYPRSGVGNVRLQVTHSHGDATPLRLPTARKVDAKAGAA